MTGSELFIPVRNTFSGKDPGFSELDKSLKRCFQAIEDWADSPFVSSAHIQNAAITNAHIADATIDAAKITNLSADKITSGTLTAEILLASKMRTGDTGTRRVEMDSTGVRLIEDDDSLVVSLPTDVDQPAYFAGTVVASNLQLGGTTSVTDVASVEVNGGQVVLQGSVAGFGGTATTPPAIYTQLSSGSYPAVTFVANGSPEGSTNPGTYWWDGVRWWHTASGSVVGKGPYLVAESAPGNVMAWIDLSRANSGIYGGAPSGPIISIAYVNSRWWALAYHGGSSLPKLYRWPSVTTGEPHIYMENNSGLSLPSGTATAYGAYPTMSALATDGGVLYLAYADSATGDMVVATVNQSNGTLSGGVTCEATALTKTAPLTFWRGAGDLGGTRNLLHWGSHYYVYNTSGTRQTADEWNSPGPIKGVTYKSGAFYEIAIPTQYVYGPAGGFEDATYWLAYSLYDSDATGGTHETELSSRAPVTGQPRRSIQVTWPPIPDSGGTDDPDRIRLYMKKSASDPGTAFGSYILQGTFADTTTNLTSYATSPTGSKAADFPTSATPAELSTGAGGFTIKGDGTLILPTFTSDPSGGVEGQIYFNSNTNKFTGYDGTSWVALH